VAAVSTVIRLRAVVGSVTASAVVLAGAVAVASWPGSQSTTCPEPAPEHHSTAGTHGSHSAGNGESGHAHDELTVGLTCNQIEMATPAQSTYVPDLAAASDGDRAEAQQLLDGVNDFCRSHSAADILSQWEAGESDPTPTHFFNPGDRSRGLDPARPRAALIYEGDLAGVMFTGKPLPALGSIPRAHAHDPSEPLEMLHVYCTTNLQDAFTPSRTLGVKADTIRLRLSIRPRLMDMDQPHLRALLRKVRGYAGYELAAVEPVQADEAGGPDPVMQAMRIEIRTSLMLLTESQLRSVQSSMRS
jgi:hypothetical protein